MKEVREVVKSCVVYNNAIRDTQTFERGINDVNAIFETEYGVEVVTKTGFIIYPWHCVCHYSGVIA